MRALSIHARRWTFVALPAVLSVSIGCGDGTFKRPGAGTDLDAKPDTTAPVVGVVDQPSNGTITVDESAISGTANDGKLSFEIPVTGDVAGSGKLSVSIRRVDDEKAFDEVSVEYDVEKGKKTTLSAVLKAPKGIDAQADRVGFNLRILDSGVLNVTRSLLHVVSPYEVRLEGPANVTIGKTVTYRVSAKDPLTQAPRAEQPVELQLFKDDTLIETFEAVTGEAGNAVVNLKLDDPGEYQVKAVTAEAETEEVLEEAVEVTATGSKVLLTTDKPVYKPGQEIHLRALALERQGGTPVEKSDVLFEIEDGKGNKILKRELKSDAYGVAATKFRFGRVLNEGTFKIRAQVGEQASEKTVQVSQYALPKFKIGVSKDKGWYRAGDTVTAQIDARYFFGKPVAGGSVTMELGAEVAGEQIFDQVVAKTNVDGKYEAKLKLPGVLPGLDINSGNALAFLRVTAVDTAGQEVVQEAPVTVAAAPVNVSLVPESTQLVPGLENRLQLFATDPLGAPVAKGKVVATLGKEELSGTTDEYGHLELLWTPTSSGSLKASVEVTAPKESPVTQEFSFDSQGGEEHLIVRTDKSVYELGDEVKLEVLTTVGTGSVFVDWLNAGQAVDMDVLTAKDGKATETITIDNSMLGSNRVEAYVVGDDGNIVRAGRGVFVRNSSSLKIELTPDKKIYAPGETAKLNFTVTDEKGEPQVAALGVQIVDEAVFALVDAKPGLLQTFFELEDSFAVPSYQLKAPGGSFASLLFNETAVSDVDANAAAQAKTEANLAALGGQMITGIQKGSWTATVAQAKGVVRPYLEDHKASLLKGVGKAADSVLTTLKGEGCSMEEYYCEKLQQPLGELFKKRLSERFAAADFWGNTYTNTTMEYDEAIRLTTAGPDEKPGTADDDFISVRFEELEDVSPVLASTVKNGGPALGGVALPEGEGVNDNGAFPDAPQAGGDDNAGTGGSASSPEAEPDADQPRVRRDFPETLYVNPAVITDASGQASLDVGMADSITEWRVSSLGHTANGRLGSSADGITVFQDFFVDVNFPATLTRGDEIDFPIAVYNYLDKAQTVDLELMPGDWFTALGGTTLSVKLEPGEVRGVSFPVRVEAVGLQTLTVKGLGAQKSDAVARTVRVVPDGKAFPTAQSGSLETGTATHSVTYPVGAVPGSPDLYLNVYPAFLSQAVSGMDSVLQVPNGCFEQTTSTTWPNVLVTDYMKATGQATPEILIKAESLISAGYQRLLTFEHPGGGFSWFGTQDPAPFLSVTAFGLMEFADMAKVHPVDAAMIERTQTWLLGKQEADGSWPGDQSEFFSFHTSEVRNTAFVVWSLASAGYQGSQLSQGLQFVKANMNKEAADAYTLAIIANAMVAAGDSAANAVFTQLEQAKKTDGDKIYWDTSVQTNFYGAGNDAAVSTTALVAHAMLLDGGHAADVAGALNYITAAKDENGNFGSTQATTWSLKTLLIAASKGTEGAVGELTVSVDGAPFATVPLKKDQHDVMTTVDMKSLALTGALDVAVKFMGTGKVSYNLVSSYHVPWTEVAEEPSGPLAVTVAYDKQQLQVDETITATVSVSNNTKLPQNMVLVTVGLPPGFEVQTQDFAPYLEQGQLSRFEVTGKQLILYVTEIAGSKQQAFKYGLRATMPIKAADGGAIVFPYYEPEKKAEAPAVTLIVN